MKTQLVLILLGLAALVLLGPTPGLTQAPGYQDVAFQAKGGAPVVMQGQGGGPGGYQGGRGGMRGDPSQFFDMLAQGGNSIDVNNLDPRMRDRIAPFLQQMGVTNGKITREQFTAGMQIMQQMRGQNGGGPGGPPGQNGQAPQDFDAQALARFQRYDLNQDGVLNSDEMPQALRDELSTWDKNHDGFIDLAEFKDWFKARQATRDAQRAQNGQAGGPGGQGYGGDQGNNNGQWQGQWPGQYPQMPNLQVEDEVKRPVVYRAGNLPRNIPTWFAQADANQDGQVSLYEWRAQGWADRDFFAMDTNSDGFITVEEVMRSQAKLQGGTDVAGMPGNGGMGGGQNGFGAGMGRGGFPNMGGGGYPNMGGGYPNMGGGYPNMGGGYPNMGGGRMNRGAGGFQGGYPGMYTPTPAPAIIIVPGATQSPDGTIETRSFYSGQDQGQGGGRGRRNRSPQGP